MKISVEDGWIPQNILIDQGEAWVELVLLKSRRPQLPFLRMELEQCQHRTKVKLDQLIETSPKEPGAPGLIFHMSRCGSTLTNNLLRQVSLCKVLGEPDALNQVMQIRWPNHSKQIAAMRTIEALFRRGLCANKETLVIKWSCWTSVYSQLILEAFPKSRWCFLYREPGEVLTSNALRTAEWLRPNHVEERIQRMRELGLPTEQCDQYTQLFLEAGFTKNMSRIELCARILGLGCNSMVSGLKESNKGLAIDYKALPDAVINQIAPHLGIYPTGLDKSKMRISSIWSSKNKGSKVFIADSKLKKQSASTEITKLANQYLLPALQQMR